jgi:hypothetical protein
MSRPHVVGPQDGAALGRGGEQPPRRRRPGSPGTSFPPRYIGHRLDAVLLVAVFIGSVRCSAQALRMGQSRGAHV